MKIYKQGITENKMKRYDKKRAQITIFVILALIIISVLVLFFLWVKPTYITPSESIKPGIEGCIESAVKETIKGIEKNDMGFSGMSFFYKYKGENIPYLCYTNLYLQQCLNQKPLLLEHFKKELERLSKDKILKCYDDFLGELKSKGYETSTGEKKIAIELNPDQIVVELNAPVVISGAGSQSFTKFKSAFSSPIYNLLIFATAIIQQETKYGDSVTDELMLLYPNIKISKITVNDGNKVYIIEDKIAGDKIKFAVRSIAWPVGIGRDTGLLRRQ